MYGPNKEYKYVGQFEEDRRVGDGKVHVFFHSGLLDMGGYGGYSGYSGPWGHRWVYGAWMESCLLPVA